MKTTLDQKALAMNFGKLSIGTLTSYANRVPISGRLIPGKTIELYLLIRTTIIESPAAPS